MSDDVTTLHGAARALTLLALVLAYCLGIGVLLFAYAGDAPAAIGVGGGAVICGILASMCASATRGGNNGE